MNPPNPFVSKSSPVLTVLVAVWALAVTPPAGAQRGPAALLDRVDAAPAATRPRLFSDAELRQEFAQPPSRFLAIDGVPIHVRDEGAGPPLLLINGRLGSLHMWDPWMPALARRFRVIRMDYPPTGLSGFDPSGKTGSARAVELVDKLADELGLEHFHIGGTSNGAVIAVSYAIEHPERIDRVVVSTLEGGRPPPRAVSSELVAAMEEQKPLAPVQSRRFFAAVLHEILANDAIIDDALIDRYWKLNNREGAAAAAEAFTRAQYEFWDTLDVRSYYGRLRRPILLQWGADAVILPPEVGESVAAMFTGTSVRLVQYPGAGHMPMLEQPEATVRDAIAFLEARE